jgi:hypothetical protein
VTAGLALGASAVGVHQAADCGEVAGLELGYRGADLCDAADNFMAGNEGYTVGERPLHSLRAWWRFEWQIPQKRISIWTSCSVGSRRTIGVEANGDVALATE